MIVHRLVARDTVEERMLALQQSKRALGDAALGAIIEAREEGAFEDIFDFCMRVDLGKVNKAVMEALIKAGAFDSCTEGTQINRGQIFGVLEKAVRIRGAL